MKHTICSLYIYIYMFFKKSLKIDLKKLLPILRDSSRPRILLADFLTRPVFTGRWSRTLPASLDGHSPTNRLGRPTPQHAPLSVVISLDFFGRRRPVSVPLRTRRLLTGRLRVLVSVTRLCRRPHPPPTASVISHLPQPAI